GESEALSIIAVIERFNPVWIAREEERLGPRIPDRKGKHPAEPMDHVGPISQKKLEQDLGVGRRLELSSARLELFPHSPVVVDSPSECDRQRAGAHRLDAGLAQVDDGEPAMAE